MLWVLVIVLAYAVVILSLVGQAELAPQFWYLFTTPLFLAAFTFGVRGALIGDIVAVISLTALYLTALAVHDQRAAEIVGSAAAAGSLSVPDVSILVARALDTGLSDPRTAAGRSAVGFLALNVTTVFFGWMVERARKLERLAADRRLGQLVLHREAEQLKRYFSPHVVDAILDPSRAMGLSTQRKDLAILFADLRGFTALTDRLEPEELERILNEYLTEMTDVVFRHRGTLDKYIGDAVMAFFGDPISYGNDAERALRAAVEMRERFQRLRSSWPRDIGDSLNVGIGVATGFVTVGPLGSPARMEYTVVGNAVNIASRLTDLAEPGQVLASARTLETCPSLTEARSLGKHNVRGVSAPVDVMEVLGLRFAAAGETVEAEFDEVLGRGIDDLEFRAALASRPDEALRPYGLTADHRRLVAQVASLAGYPVFQGVPGPGMVRFIRLALRESFPAGTVILRQGEAARRFYLVSQGEVAIVQADADGRERHIATMSRGNHFGESGLLAGGTRNATVRAIADVELFSLDEAGFRQVLEELPELARNLEAEARRRAGADTAQAEARRSGETGRSGEDGTGRAL